MKVLVLDDEALVADLISDYIKSIDKTIEVLQTLANTDLIRFIEINSINLIFLDLYMPNLIGFDILKEVKSIFPNIKVVILSSHFQAKNIEKALELGANGYLSKSISKREILTTFDYLAQNKIYLCTECYRELNFAQLKELNPKFNIKEVLTKREIEVLSEIVDGCSTSQIAERLFISQHTVESHKKNLYEKFGVRKVTQLVKLAVENNII